MPSPEVPVWIALVIAPMAVIAIGWLVRTGLDWNEGNRDLGYTKKL